MNASKRIDAKGRLTLGPAYANLIVLIHENKTGDLVIKKADIVPSHEAWLYENPKALQSLKRGILQAKKRQFVKDPMEEEGDMCWLDNIKE
jgi:hypothetical protein